MTVVQDLFLIVPMLNDAGPPDPLDVKYMWARVAREAQKAGRLIAGPIRPAGDWDPTPEYQHDGIVYRQYSIATVPIAQ